MEVNDNWPPREKDPTWTPDEWRALTRQEREWYVKFWQATERGNMDVLQQLADAAGADFERLKKEVKYESRIAERMEYTIPTQRFPEYSEWDYGWSAPRPCPVKLLSRASDNPGNFGESMQKEIRLPEYAGAPSAVRQVPPDEYWNTRKTGTPKGVSLETELQHARREENNEIHQSLDWDNE